MRITSVRFTNFKSFADFSVSLDHVNVLVGPNNCGKSTVIGAFRVLAAALRQARSRRPEPMSVDGAAMRGYHISPNVVPISLENVHHELSASEAAIRFRMTGGHALELRFPVEGGCIFFADLDGSQPITPTAFKNAFPLTVGQVPVLGPLEHEETIVEEATVQRGLVTHRASRHFRNYWRHWPEGFEAFAQLVRATWPGMEILAPERASQLANHLVMYCLESRITRELYWAGFGFQVWCQLLTHLSRSSDDTIVVVDEPEIYLHPDLQRQLLQILRDLGPDVLLATHSSEIMADSDPTEIVLVDKARRSGQRLRDIEGVQEALDAVGSVQNITLTQLARTRRVLFTEGLHDFRLLRRFARQLGLGDLAAGAGVTPVESGGFSSWDEIRALARGFQTSLGQRIGIAAVFDSDYWPPERVQQVLGELRRHLASAHIHARKEIENYLLDPMIVDRALRSAVAERERRLGTTIPVSSDAASLLEEITSPMKSRVLAQYVARRQEHLRRDRRDDATIAEETLDALEPVWEVLETRIALVSGKEVLAQLRSRAQELYQVSLTDYRLIDSYRSDEVPTDLVACLTELNQFCLGALPVEDSA